MSETPQSTQTPILVPLDETSAQNVEKDPILLAQEIVDTRTAWYFRGRCANGTRYPDGQTNPDSGSDETGAGNNGPESRYYNGSTSHIDVTRPNLFFAAQILTSTLPYGGDKDPETLVIAKTPSKDAGYDEVVITGMYAEADKRSSISRYHLVNRLKSEEATKLYVKLKEDPSFIDTFIKTAFPKIDSSVDEYNGLYRLLAKKLAIIDDTQLNELSEKYKAEPSFPVGRYIDPRIPMSHAQKIIDETSVELTKPTGVGTVTDFAPLKMKYNDQ